MADKSTMTLEDALNVLCDEHYKLADLSNTLSELLVEMQNGQAPRLHSERFLEASRAALVRALDAHDEALVIVAGALPA